MTRPRLASWLLAAFGAFFLFLALPWPAPASGIDAPRGALILSGGSEAEPAPLPGPPPRVAPVMPPVPTSELRLAEATLDRVADHYVAPLGAGHAVLTTVPRLQERIEKVLSDHRVPWAAAVLLNPSHRSGAGHGRALPAGAGTSRPLARGPGPGGQRVQDRHQLGPAPARLSSPARRSATTAASTGCALRSSPTTRGATCAASRSPRRSARAPTWSSPSWPTGRSTPPCSAPRPTASSSTSPSPSRSAWRPRAPRSPRSRSRSPPPRPASARSACRRSTAPWWPPSSRTAGSSCLRTSWPRRRAPFRAPPCSPGAFSTSRSPTSWPR